jgi:hypothetical protein
MAAYSRLYVKPYHCLAADRRYLKRKRGKRKYDVRKGRRKEEASNPSLLELPASPGSH